MHAQVLPVGLMRRSGQVTEGKRPRKINTEEMLKKSIKQSCVHSYYRKNEGFISHLFIWLQNKAMVYSWRLSE